MLPRAIGAQAIQKHAFSRLRINKKHHRINKKHFRINKKHHRINCAESKNSLCPTCPSMHFFSLWVLVADLHYLQTQLIFWGGGGDRPDLSYTWNIDFPIILILGTSSKYSSVRNRRPPRLTFFLKIYT